MEDKKQKEKLTAINWIYLAGFVAFLIAVLKYGGIRSTPPYLIPVF